MKQVNNMKIRLGYVAISMRLGKKITSSSTVTFANYNKLTTHEKKLEKLKKVILWIMQEQQMM